MTMHTPRLGTVASRVYDAHTHRRQDARGIKPSRWGAIGWAFIHLVALGYPSEPTPRDAAEYGRFFASLGDILPCMACRDHLRDHVRQCPPANALAAGRAELFAWTVALHNRVNESLGRPTRTMESTLRYYTRVPLTVVAAHRRWVDVLAGAVAVLAVLVMWQSRYAR